MTDTLFTRPTTDCWRALRAPWPGGRRPAPPYRFEYEVALPDGRVLALPLRVIPRTDPAGRALAVASLIANQASLEVADALAAAMAERARESAPDLIVGLPTLGLVFAPEVARRLGHPRYAPLSYSRKYWYEEALSEPVSSITSPGEGKRLFLDPNLAPRLAGRRVAVVDDALSTGRTMAAAARLLGRAGVEIAAVVVAMAQTVAWRDGLDGAEPGLSGRVLAAFGTPLFALDPGAGWVPVPGTDPAVAPQPEPARTGAGPCIL